ncbi:Casein kinase II subunit beta [Aphelenchoides bicaudatus]|nr:Casein kinase II subunit beta [Aphelenchoides bicaudatus]
MAAFMLGADLLSSTQTWPKSRICNTLAQQVNETIRMDQILNQAREFVNSSPPGQQLATESATDSSPTTLHHEQAKILIERLCDELEKCSAAAQRSGTMAKLQQNLGSRPLSIIREENNNAGRKKDGGGLNSQPDFSSMILCDAKSRLSQHSVVEHPYGNYRINNYNDGVQDVDLNSLYKDQDPWYIRAIPHVLMLVVSFAYVFAGAYILQILDPKLGEKPYRTIVLFSFQILTTIGWGDSHPKTRASMGFIIVYTIIGIPMLFSMMANCGRIISEVYTVDWLFLSAVVRGRKPIVRSNALMQRLPLKAAMQFMFFFLFIGMMLYNGLLQEMGSVEAVYFIVTSIETTGIGDFVPQPKNMMETVVELTYIGAGITLMSALLINISYHYQKLYHVHLAGWLHDMRTKREDKHKVLPLSVPHLDLNRNGM